MGAIYWLVRVAAFVGLLFLVGLGVLVPLLWREGGRSRRIGRLLWLSWSVLLGATLVGIAIQGVYAAALPLTDIYRPSLVNAVLHTRFGEIELLRVALLAAMIPVILGIQDRLGRDHSGAGAGRVPDHRRLNGGTEGLEGPGGGHKRPARPIRDACDQFGKRSAPGGLPHHGCWAGDGGRRTPLPPVRFLICRQVLARTASALS